MIKWQIITIDHERQSSDRHISAKGPQQCKREILAPSTPYQHLHKGMLNYSLIIRESPCGRRVTLTPAANWHINNPACLSWRGSRSERRNLLSASTFCLAAPTVRRRIRTRRHTCSAVSWLTGWRHAGLFLLLLLGVAPVPMWYVVCPAGADMWCHHVSWSFSATAKRERASCFTFPWKKKNSLPVWRLCEHRPKLPAVCGCEIFKFCLNCEGNSGDTHSWFKMEMCGWKWFQVTARLRNRSGKLCGSPNWYLFYIYYFSSAV